MFQTTHLASEFLAESNIALNQTDSTPEMHMIIVPIRSFLQSKDRPLMAYSLARNYGAPSQLAFFLEFSHFTGQILQDLQILTTYNYTYFLSLIPPLLRTEKAVIKEVKEQSKGQILTMQLAYLNQKLEQLRIDAYTRYPESSRYLTYERFNKIFLAQNRISRTLLSSDTTLSEYLVTLGGGFNFFSVALPVLVGLTCSLKAENGLIDPEKIQWGMLESAVTNISLLVRLSSKIQLSLFLKEQVTANKLEWYLSPVKERIDLAISDSQVTSQFQEIRTRIRDKTQSDLAYLALPEEYKTNLKQLLDWASLLGNTVSPVTPTAS